VDHNVIDRNGEGIMFSGDDGDASSNSNVYDNLLTNARIHHDADSWWPAGNPIGAGNVLHDNCIRGGAEGPLDTSGGGFSAYSNLFVDPDYVDAGAYDYHLAPTSPCLPITGDIAAVVAATNPAVRAPSPAHLPKASMAGTLNTKRTRITFSLRCRALGSQVCRGRTRTTTFEKLGADGKSITGLAYAPSGRGKVVALADVAWSVRAGDKLQVTIQLNRAARILLAKFERIPATLKIIPAFNGYTLPAIRGKVRLKRSSASALWAKGLRTRAAFSR